MFNSTDSLDVEIRIPILRSALLIEKFTTTILSNLLDIEYSKQSLSLGRNGISFQQKVSMLIDIGALKSDNKAKFIKFMEIRNTFLHDLDAKTYELCVDSVKGNGKWLLDTYPQLDSLTREEKLKNCCLSLMQDVYMLSIGLLHKIVEKSKKDTSAKLSIKMKTHTLEVIKEIAMEFNTYAEYKIKERAGIETFKNIGDKMNARFFQLLTEKMGWNDKSTK